MRLRLAGLEAFVPLALAISGKTCLSASLTLPNGSTPGARNPPHIGAAEFMPPPAVGSDRGQELCPAAILFMGDGFEVFPVGAKAVAAEMVQFEAGGDRSNEMLIHDTVDHDQPRRHADLPITLFTLSPGPFPAPGWQR